MPALFAMNDILFQVFLKLFSQGDSGCNSDGCDSATGLCKSGCDAGYGFDTLMGTCTPCIDGVEYSDGATECESCEFTI